MKKGLIAFLLITLFYFSYISLNVLLAEGTNLPFIIKLYSQILSTIIDNVFYIFVFIPIHTFRMIFISFPQPSNIFQERYNIDISGPFSRLLPRVNNFLHTLFPFFTMPAKYHFYTVKFNYFVFKHPTTFYVMKYTIIATFSFFVLFLFRRIIKRIIKLNLIKICLIIFSIFIILHHWILIKGPFYSSIGNILQEITNFHSNLITGFINLFKGKKSNEKVLNTTDKVNDDQPANLFQTILYKTKNTFKKSINSNDEEAATFHRIKLIHPHQFDQLFIYFIYSFVWSIIICLIRSLFIILNKLISKAKNGPHSPNNTYNYVDLERIIKENDKNNEISKSTSLKTENEAENQQNQQQQNIKLSPHKILDNQANRNINNNNNILNNNKSSEKVKDKPDEKATDKTNDKPPIDPKSENTKKTNSSQYNFEKFNNLRDKNIIRVLKNSPELLLNNSVSSESSSSETFPEKSSNESFSFNASTESMSSRSSFEVFSPK